MGFFNFFKKRDNEPKQTSMVSFLTGGTSSKRITPDNALSLSAVYACVKVISETIGTLPLNLYKIEGEKRTVAKEHPLYSILKYYPNPYMNYTQLIEALTSSMLLRGNGYLNPVKTRGGQTAEIEFIKPQNITIDDTTSTPFYRYQSSTKSAIFKYDELINIPYFTTDGIHGITPIEECKNSLDLANSSEEFGKNFYDNGAMPMGVIQTPFSFPNEETLSRFRSGWDKNYGGNNKFKTAVLEGGATYNGIPIKNSDAQYIEGRQFSVQDIARMFRVPPHLIGDLSKATFSNIEQQAMEFEKYTIRPLVTKIEAAFNQRLLTDKEKPTHFFKFNTSALLRGDMKSRYESYNIGRNAGFLSVNEIRALEDLNPIENGDIYLQPLNMITAGENNEAKWKIWAKNTN